MARSFAHFVGLGRRARAEETDDEKKERETAEQEKRDDEMSQKAASGEDTGETDDEKKEREDREAKRSKAKGAADDADPDEDGDDDSDKEEMRGHSTIARARARERGRIAAIMASPQALQNPGMALELACNTMMSRDEAVGVLARAPAPARAERAARNPSLGPGGSVTGPQGGSAPEGGQIQQMWGKAFERFTGARR